MPFRDRQDAGGQLAARLEAYRDRGAVVFALPRGGVAVGLPIALALRAPLDLLLVRKIGVPGFPELAMGAIVDGAAPITVRNEDVIRLEHVSEADFDRIAKQELVELERRRETYLPGRQALSPSGRTAIVVDDGVATGATLKAALGGLRRKQPARIVVAVPVAPRDFVEALKMEVDDVVCLKPLDDIGSVGQHYLDFGQLTDDDVIDLMARSRPGADPAS